MTTAARVVYTPLLFWADAFTPLPSLILMQPRWKNNAPLLAHEQTHARQMQRLGVLRFWWWYATNPRRRLALEVEAYQAQLLLSPNSIDIYAGFLARDYGLQLNFDGARLLLLQAPIATEPRAAP